MGPRRTASHPESAGQGPERYGRPPSGEPSDHYLVMRTRAGEQDAATQLYLRYVKRLKSLVRRRCSKELARCAGVEDIVQSVFATFFRRVGEGCYDIPDGDEVWKVLLVIALNKVRTQATYHYAAKRDAHRTINGAEALIRLKLHANDRKIGTEHFQVILTDVLERLHSRDAILVRLRIDGFSVGEIARKMERSKRTVERVIHETRQTLGELLKEED
jgi:RNA polymerase sigma-70 factor (ECF subfamily)